MRVDSCHTLGKNLAMSYQFIPKIFTHVIKFFFLSVTSIMGYGTLLAQLNSEKDTLSCVALGKDQPILYYKICFIQA